MHKMITTTMIAIMTTNAITPVTAPAIAPAETLVGSMDIVDSVGTVESVMETTLVGRGSVVEGVTVEGGSRR